MELMPSHGMIQAEPVWLELILTLIDAPSA